MLLLEVDEVSPTPAEVADQLMLFIFYFMKDGIVVYAVHDLLIDSYLLRLDSLEFLPLCKFLLSSQETLKIFDEELEFLDQAFGLLLVEPVGDELVCEEQTRVLVLRRHLVARYLEIVHKLLVVAVVFEVRNVLLQLLGP